MRLQIGSVLCEVSCYALPCRTNKPWFIDGDFDVMHHDRGPVSRVYATVLRTGRDRVGDDAILEPYAQLNEALVAESPVSLTGGHSASPESCPVDQLA